MDERSQDRPRPWGYWTAGVVSASAVGMILLAWPTVGLEVLAAGAIDLGLVVLLLSAATALGAGIVGALGVGPMPRPLALLLSAALGTGAISLAMLGLGLAGWLSRPVLFGLPVTAAVIGAVPLWRLWRGSGRLAGGRAVSTRWSWAGLVLAPAVAVAIAAVSLPPGILWSGNLPDTSNLHYDLEGRSYDALEYHLQVPREYLDGGRVRFLSHNVYSAFPENAEMWFMLLMGLVGRPQAAVYLVQTLNLVLAALAVAAVYVAGRLGRDDAPGRRGPGGVETGGGALAALAVAAVPMLAAVAVVAYVEPMMMFFMAVAWAMIRYYQLAADGPAAPATASDGSRGRRPAPSTASPAPLGAYALTAGLLLGLSAGCKYLAIPLFIGPLLLGLVLTGGSTRLPAGRKLRHGMLLVTGLLIAFAPWMVRNAAQADGNPVYPLLWSVFGGGNWSAADALRWQNAHRPTLPLVERLARAAWRFGSHPSLVLLSATRADRAMTGSSLYGPWLYLLCWPILLARSRSRWDVLLAVTAAGQFAAWVFLSAVPGRFILPAVLPLGLLIGRSMAAARPLVRGAMLLILLSFASVSGLQLLDRFLADTQVVAQPGQSRLAAAGRLFRAGESLFERSPYSASGCLNGRLATAGASPTGPPILWLVGDSQPFYLRYPAQYQVVFSRDILAEMLADHPPAAVRRWLRNKGFRYLYVDWWEVARLRGSYGFPDSVQPAALAALGRVEPLRRLDPRGRLWLIDLTVPPPAPATQPR